MGLDVYIHKYSNFDEAKRLEKLYEEESHKNWDFGGKKYEEMTEAEKAQASKADEELQVRLKLNSYGEPGDKEDLNEPSVKHPDHMFKIGYFRSSYNEGGINSVCRNLLGKEGLYYVFGTEFNDHQYEWRPDWAAAKERALEMARDLRAKIDEMGGSFRCFKVGFNQLSGPTFDVDSAEEAMAVFQEHVKGPSWKRDRMSTESGSYSNGAGVFFPKQVNVVALIDGVEKAFFSEQKYPCTYVIYEEKEDGYAWYIQSLEIVAETCDYILSQPDADKFYIAWSS